MPKELSIELRLSSPSKEVIDSWIDHIADAVIERVTAHLKKNAEHLIGPVLDQAQARFDGYWQQQQQSVARDVSKGG